MEKGYDSLGVTGIVFIYIACELKFDMFIYHRADQENRANVE